MRAKDLERASRPNPLARITPRTCLWPLAISLVVTFGLSIGLTFRSDHHCYAGTCGEWLFPLQARLHVVIWYAWLSLSTTFLAIRAFHPELQKLLARHVSERKLPALKRNLSRGGLLMLFWVFCLYGTVIGVWWPRLHGYFRERNEVSGITKGSGRLAAIALTGHLCDITMGIVLLPISRHSALASFFQIATSTALMTHVLAAYTLFTLVIIHGCLYLSWIPAFNSLPVDLRKIIPVLNPTYLYHETWPGNSSSLGIWRASLIFSGSLAAIIMVALFVTTLPRLRVKYFNLFYFTHLSSILMVVIICLHASTMFYCTAPGLAMWLLDWSMRLHELRKPTHGDIVKLERGWYCITLPLPRIRLSGCACRSPIAHFFIHHAESSIRELHPFTTITHLASQDSATEPSDPSLLIQFLFRTRGTLETNQSSSSEGSLAGSYLPLHLRLPRLVEKMKRRKGMQWTTKVAKLAEDKEKIGIESSCRDSGRIEPARVELSLRLEGPYFTPADPYRYDSTVCLVAGTGISGALAIGSAFNKHASEPSPSLPAEDYPKQRRRWTCCTIIWSVKADEDIELPFLEPRSSGLEVRKFLTGRKRSETKVNENQLVGSRVNLEREMNGLVFPTTGEMRRTWVYISGPKQFIASAKTACKIVEKAGAMMDVYAASWDP